MPIEYRTLRPDEEEALLRLWVDVLDLDWENRRRIFGDFGDDPQRFARTHVAIAEDGTLLAATSYWLRELRALDGTTCRTGHLWGVATRPEARGQGHATRLLELSVKAMQQEGCLWSILFARPEARGLYARAGWQSVPHRYRAGLLAEPSLEVTSPYIIRAIDPQQETGSWPRLAIIYGEENRERPFTLVRTVEYWQGYVTWMLGEWIQNHCATLLIAAPKEASDEWCGYAIAHFYNAEYAQQAFGSPPWFFISEAAGRAERCHRCPFE